MFVAMMFSLVGLLFISALAGSPPSVPANATLYLTVRPPFPRSSLSASSASSLRGRRRCARPSIPSARPRRQPREGVVVTPVAGGGALWAQLQEVRAAIQDFRTSGKKVIAYLESGGAQEYYLASAADRVVLMPAGSST
jgi:protease-4